MYLLVGLGNPGTGYARHRHNIGFMAVDAIASLHGFSPFKARFKGRLADGKLGNEKVLLLKPETFMNLSGQSVLEAVQFHKIPLENVIVFHDDLDLAPGKVRTKMGGGHGGHNGLRNIDALMGPNYNRVRLGIGHPGRKELVHSYVLNDFSADDKEWLTALIDSIAKNAALLAARDEAGFMNRIALAVKPTGKADAPEKPAGKVTRTSSAAPDTASAAPTVTVIGKDPTQAAPKPEPKTGAKPEGKRMSLGDLVSIVLKPSDKSE